MYCWPSQSRTSGYERRLVTINRYLIVGFVFLLLAIGLSTNITGHRIIKAQRTGCTRGIHDRLDEIWVDEAGIRGNLIIASDILQPIKTRKARVVQAAIEQTVVNDLRIRVDPAHGGKLICAQVYPEPSLIPYL